MMAEEEGAPAGPNLAQGIIATELQDGGMLLGHVDGEEIILARQGSEIFAVSAHCTHYHGPLAEGVLVGSTVRCPWHHACFDLRTGEAVRAPALSPLTCWSVEQEGDRIFVRKAREQPKPSPQRRQGGDMPGRIVIVGGGAAGFAAAEMFRREQYDGRIIMLSNDSSPPVDRPNLSKDYLAGNAPQDWLPLRPDSFYTDCDIDLRLRADVTAIDPRSREVSLADGDTIPFHRLLLATGAEPIRLPIPGADLPHVHTLRSLVDCEAIIDSLAAARRVVVIGASFIGLEVAASLRNRDLEVHVVAPEERPMERILGPKMGDFIRALHEEHGVVFHLGDKPAAIDHRQVMLESGATLSADLVVVGVGVRPRSGLAEKAGLTLDRGVLVNAFLETSAPGIFAAGDIARWPDAYSGENIRVEHWVVAERHGQTAARNMLGYREQFTDVPFFWSQHYDIPINYVGHAEKWDGIEIEGDIAGKDCLLRYKRHGRVMAVASIFRDVENLRAEIEMEAHPAI